MIGYYGLVRSVVGDALQIKCTALLVKACSCSKRNLEPIIGVLVREDTNHLSERENGEGNTERKNKEKERKNN
jgi:hypothetical protein